MKKESSNIVSLAHKKGVITSPETEGVILKQVKDCMQVLNTYGKKDFDYLPVVKVFIERLGHYGPEKIKKAFDKYVSKRSDFPTPADIVGIIEKRIKPDIAVYQTLIRRRKEGAWLSTDEENYLRSYEEQAINEWD
jgi:hypothetical protein